MGSESKFIVPLARPSGAMLGIVMKLASDPNNPPRNDAICPKNEFIEVPFMPLIRASREADLPAITAIYAHHVLHGTGSFETEPPSLCHMTARRADVLGKGLPHLVAEQDGEVVGFAYGNWFKPRPAYRYSVEDSIYLTPDLHRKGLGRALLAELLARCESAGIRKVIAIIGDSANAGSVGVHLALGFEQVGKIDACGWKFSAWRDIVIMQKTLGLGDTQPPGDA